MSLFRKLDDFLIDKCFQPIADRLANRISVNNLAQNALILTSLISVYDFYFRWSIDILNIMDIIFGPLFVVFLFSLCMKSERKTKQGMMPIARQEYFFLRILVLVLLLINGLFMLAPAKTTHISLIMSLVETVGLYFMACRSNPPTQHREAKNMVDNAIKIGI